MSGNSCSQGNLIVAFQQNNLPVLYTFCNSFYIRDVHGEFGLINVHLFDMLRAISSIFFCVESCNPVRQHKPKEILKLF